MINRLFYPVVVCCLTFFSMMAYSAPADYINRPEVTRFIEDISQKNNLDQEWITQTMDQAVYQPSVIKYILPGTKATRSWKRYREIMINSTRIQQGMAFWAQNEETLRRAEKEFGVPAQYIVSIIGIETAYGRNMGNFRLIDALTTLAFDYPRRAEFFRQELEAFFVLCKEQGWDPLTIKGSYAGAIGLPQFMPSSYRQYAVDFDNDGKIRLFDSPADAIGSVANYLAVHGWQTNRPVAEPVLFKTSLPATEKWQNPTIRPELSASHLEPFLPVWEKKEPQYPFALILLDSPDMPKEYWLGFQNFYVISRYNKSSFYAMSVFQLGQAILEKRDAARN